MILAIQIERKFTKQEILEMYLNQIYFGQGAYGVQAAAQTYFGKNVEDLTVAESAMLAGIPRSPNYYSPTSNMKAAKSVQETVLEQMVKYSYLSPEEAKKAKDTPIKLTSKPENGQFASYFVDYVTQSLVDRYGADAVYKEGLQIYTTLDIEAQQAAEKALALLPTYHTDKDGLKQPQGALVAIEPQTGYIKAMVGGRGNDQFNRAVMAVRQPGSSFKPFVYLAALENGFTAATVVDDSATSFGTWSPLNYDGKFRGPLTLRAALEKSVNVIAVKVASQVGIDKIIGYAKRLGITTLVTSGAISDLNLATALGGLTNGVTPLQMASAYGTIGNQGVRAEPMAVVKVLDRNGTILEQRAPKQSAVINEKSAYVLTDMMRGILTHGTGTGANIGRPAAGKTGTTSDYVDAWFVGFTPDLACAVWIGADNNGSLGGITGGDLPATIWRNFMMEALEKVPASDFTRPSGIVNATINPNTGLLAPATPANGQTPTKPADKTDGKPTGKPGDKPNNKPPDKSSQEIFIQGTQPTQYSPPVTPAPPITGKNPTQPFGIEQKEPTIEEKPNATPNPSNTTSKPSSVPPPENR
jgi:penicillin-binding protein 1A